MALGESFAVGVGDSSAVAEARRRAASLAASRGFDDVAVGRVAIVVTEAASNLVKHAGGGQIIARAVVCGGGTGVEILALDRGPGIRDLGAAFRDGYSSAGTSGTGLGAIRRASAEFDVYSTATGGTALLAVLAGPGGFAVSKPGLRVAGVSVAMPGEDVSGDDWATRETRDGRLIVVIDGLGHGIGAADAAQEARRAFGEAPELGPAQMLAHLHRELRPTRGVAAAVVLLEPDRERLLYAGVGNIAGYVLGGERARALVSHAGILGHQAQRIQEFSYAWTASSTLVLHSDGLTSHWNLDAYPGVLRNHPGLIAGILYRDFWRQRDDVTVVVSRPWAA